MLDRRGGDHIVSADQRMTFNGVSDRPSRSAQNHRYWQPAGEPAPARGSNRASGNDRLCAKQGCISRQKIEARTGFDDATFGRGAIDQDIVERATGMYPQSHCQVPLGIGIDQQNARALQCQTRTHIDHRCGFADAALEVCNCNDPCHIPLRTHLRFVYSV
jgi:hypothetical protein